MKLTRLGKNVILAGITVAEHFGDDPAVLALQLSRRLPAAVVRPLVAAAALAPGVLLPAMADVVRGRKEEVEQRVALASASGIRPRPTVRLADVAIAAALPELAAQLLASAPSSTAGWTAAQARLRWYLGDMSGAVAAIGSAQRRTERRLQARLASELSVFDGWAPVLPAVANYRAKPETVLHLLTNSLPGTGSGYAQRSQSLLHAQHQLGWSVHAVTRIGYPVQVGRLGAHDVDIMDGVTYHRLLPARLPQGMAARLQRQAEAMLKLALEVKPTVLHTTTHFVNGLVVRAVSEALGIPWVYEVRGQLADTWASTRAKDAKLSERYRKFNARESDIMRSAGAVATLGETMRSGILAAGVPSEDTLLLPNAVGESFLAEPMAPAAARARLKLGGAGPFIGTVSSLVEYEGLDDLLHAFKILAPQYPELRCLIVGDGVAGASLRRLATDLGLEKQIIFPGRVARNEASLYHQALDVFVVPRKDLEVTRAVTPLKPVEAMACARPVVGSALPALAELIEEGENGFMVEPSSPQELAARIEELIVSPELREKLGRNGRSQVLRTRTWLSDAQSAVQRYELLTRVQAGAS